MTANAIATRLKEIRQRGPQTRIATVVREGINLEDHTVELSFSSETDAVMRFYGVEILGHDAGEVDLTRLGNGAPVLWQHDWRDQRGVVLSARIDADRVGRAVVKFSRSPAGDQLFQDIVDGIVTKVSVGYSVDGLEVTGERDGVTIYRVTAWTPYEISMVSIPADDSVGVGRTPENLNQENRSWQVPGTGTPSVEDKRTTMNYFQDFLRRAQEAKGDTPIFDGNGDVRAVRKRRAAVVSAFSLRELEMPAFASGGLRTVHLPVGTEAGKVSKLSDAVLSGSRAHAAGARVLIVPAAKPATVNNGLLVYERENMRFECIEAAPFASIDDGDDVTYSGLPIYRDGVDLDHIQTYGFGVKLSRADQRAYPDGELADSALASIALGVSRLADKVLLGAILDKSPGAFSIAETASLGVLWSELKALVGTNGAGAAVAEDGTLRACPSTAFNTGVVAELTKDMAPTLIGAWNRAAIAVHEDIQLVAERTNVQGDLVLVAWVNIQALLPMPGAFWTVGA